MQTELQLAVEHAAWRETEQQEEGADCQGVAELEMMMLSIEEERAMQMVKRECPDLVLVPCVGQERQVRCSSDD